MTENRDTEDNVMSADEVSGAVARLLHIQKGIQDLKGAAQSLVDSGGDIHLMHQAIEYMRSGWLRIGIGIWPLSMEQLAECIRDAILEAGNMNAVLEDLTTITTTPITRSNPRSEASQPEGDTDTGKDQAQAVEAESGGVVSTDEG